MNFLLILAATGFLFVKTGEKFATQEMAGPTVALFTAKLPGDYAPHIFNDPTKAVEYCAKAKPAAGIVTPGFYLAYAKVLGMTPILEVKRANVATERYVLVAKEQPGSTIATPLAAEQIYVLSVILAGKYGDELRLKPTTDVEGAVIDLAEGAKNAPDSVLMEEATWQAIGADPDLASKVKVVYTSEELPGNLVVTFPGATDIDKLTAAIKEMPVEVLNQLRVESFSEIDAGRLKKAQERFYGK